MIFDTTQLFGFYREMNSKRIWNRSVEGVLSTSGSLSFCVPVCECVWVCIASVNDNGALAVTINVLLK